MDAIVVEVTRNGITEAEHIISAVVVDEHAKVMAFWGDSDMRFYWRSSAKPFQALPLLATGAADAFGLTDDEIAIACASHHGSIEHQATIKSMLGKAGLDVNALQCGVHPPMDESERRRLICSDEKPTPLHHNCSGKHAGMLITAKHLGESIDNYRLPEHPVQQCILKLATEFTCYPQLHDTVTSDGCGAPIWATPLRSMALAWARLAGADDYAERHPHIKRIHQAMVNHPIMIAGIGSFDTKLIEIGAGAWICKGGAEACIGIAHLKYRMGIALKVHDGNHRPIPTAVTWIMSQLGWLSSEQSDAMAKWLITPIRNSHGDVVGCMRVRKWAS